ncbi:DMT family transporter [Tepidibacillus infernus]|uniref:DMT family transporter n=1 Tax=Tepidibacillus TaxID=1494427 RepID=UPI000852D5A7|nr:DMT family transporter [Tepidibacillus sp. HK-1]GBF12035.1 EamA-like transporter family protein [Tepidibacillus sp. HK-1]
MNSDKPSQIKLAIALFIGIIAVSSSAILVKQTTAPSAIIATYRMMFTVLIMIIPTFFFHFQEMKKLQKKDYLYSFLSGLFLAFHFITWFESLKYTSIASSVVLVTMSPIFSMIGESIFFKKRYPLLSILGSLVSIIGGILIGLGDFRISGKALLGDLLALLGALMVTVYWLFGQKVRTRLTLLPYTLLVYGSSTIILVIYSFSFHYSFTQYEKTDWIVFIALAVIPNILGHTVFNWAIKYTNATTISMVLLGEPIGASILATLIYKEAPTLIQIIGGLIILLGLYVFQRYQIVQNN